MRHIAHGDGAAAEADGDVNTLGNDAKEAQQCCDAWGARGSSRVAARGRLRERRRGDSKDSEAGDLREHHLYER